MRRSVISFAVLIAAPLAASPLLAGDPMFNPNILHETRIVMDPKDWQSLRDNFRTNQQYAANLSVDNEVIEQVAIRSRGKGSRSGIKPGLDVDFDQYIKSQRFHGYASLVIDNLTQDPTFLKEPLSYAVFEAMGIPAPQIAHTRLTVNDEYWGVYTLVENIRKPFLRERFGEDTGNLFKYEYEFDYRFENRGQDAKAYVPVPFEPKTNEDHLDTTGLLAFIAAINEAPDASFAQSISAFLDLDKFVSYLAAENAIAEDDGITGYAGMNNYYLYQFNGGNKFIFLPWDKDTTFLASAWPIFQRMDTNTLTRRLLNDPAQRANYLAALRRAAPAVSALTPKLEAMYSLIREAALADTKKPWTNDEFENSVGGVRGIIAERAADILAQVAAASRAPVAAQ
jgi:spore coat protein H